MFLCDILSESRIRVPLAAGDKEGVIAELVDALVATGDVTDRDKMLTAVLERERTRTTGIGGGIAIPHGKSAAAGNLSAAIGRAQTPVDFGSIDGKGVTLVILLVSPLDKTGPHIQALARISRLLSIDSLRNKMMTAASAQEMFSLLKEQEQANQ